MPSSLDDIIALYKTDVDRALIRENLKLTIEERVARAQEFSEAAEEVRAAGVEARRKAREVRSHSSRP